LEYSALQLCGVTTCRNAPLWIGVYEILLVLLRPVQVQWMCHLISRSHIAFHEQLLWLERSRAVSLWLSNQQWQPSHLNMRSRIRYDSREDINIQIHQMTVVIWSSLSDWFVG
jgi:hypothetical protein